MSQAPIRPSDGELAILRVLWTRGPSTVREVHAELSKERELGYTTVLKLMQIMAEKGLVDRDESARTHVYRPLQEEAPTQAFLVRDLLARAFGGRAPALVQRALEAEATSPEQLDEIQRMLDAARARRS